MTRDLRALWVPAGSFGLAILLALFVGPATRIMALRVPMDSTGGCRHEKWAFPSGINASVCTYEGFIELIRRPRREEFHLKHDDVFTATWRCVTKTDDASLAVRVAHKSPDVFHPLFELSDSVDVISESNLAALGFNLAEGNPKDCCHTGRFNAHGMLEARLAIPGPVEYRTAGHASVGRFGQGSEADTPAHVKAKIEYDNNCNGIPDSLQNDVSTVLRLFVRNDSQIRPILAGFFGYIDGQITEIIDTTGIQYPPNKKDYDDIRRRPFLDGLIRNVTKPFGFSDVTKKFREQCRGTIDVERASVRVEVEREKKELPYPETRSILIFDTKGLSILDTDESKLVEIIKNIPR